MAKKIGPPSRKSLSPVTETFEWRYKPFTIDTCELWHESELIASMKRWGVFPVRKFTGKIYDRRFELRLIKADKLNKQLSRNEAVQYSLLVEGRRDEWKAGGVRKELGRLEYKPNAVFGGKYNFWTGHEGPSFINIPAKIIINGMGVYGIDERIEGSETREYSIVDMKYGDDPRALGMTTRPPEGELCGTFKRFEKWDEDPDSLILAIMSYAFAQIVYHSIDAHA